MRRMTGPPQRDETAPYYFRYIDRIPSPDVLGVLARQLEESPPFLRPLSRRRKQQCRKDDGVHGVLLGTIGIVTWYTSVGGLVNQLCCPTSTARLKTPAAAATTKGRPGIARPEDCNRMPGR